MKSILSIFLLAISVTSFASPNNNVETKAFNCMNKDTFEINNECIGQSIESNVVFQKTQKEVLTNADTANDRTLATMTFDNRTMTINIVAHKDATIANVDTSTLKK